MSDRQPITLFSPGPVPMSEASLKIMGSAPIHHRSKDFTKSLKNAHCELSGLLKTPDCLAFTSTGSGGLESSVVNLLSKGERALCLEGGKFGERWKEILSAYDIDHDVISFGWGQTPPIGEVIKHLQKSRQLGEQPYSVLYMQACETSTGTAYDVSEIAGLLEEFSKETLLVVDGITAVGAYPISVEDGIDVLITGSQKALGLSTGAAFVGLSKRALKKAETSDLPKFYFNYLEELKSLNAGSTRFSSPVQIWLCLEEELEAFKNLDQKFLHCLKLQEMMFDWCKKESLDLFSLRPSPSLTAVHCPKGISSSNIRAKMLDNGYFIAGGQGDFKDSIFRVGHMGAITTSMMTAFLDTFSQVLKELKKEKSTG